MKDTFLKKRKGTCKPIGKTRPLPTFAGRSIGIVVIVFVQSLIGAIHIFFGLWLLSVSTTDCLYSVYTTVFGLMSLLFALGFWMGRSWGWLGTVCTLLFVTIADALTLLDLPSIPGIPKLGAFAEIAYSVILLLYLFQPHVRHASAEKTPSENQNSLVLGNKFEVVVVERMEMRVGWAS